MKQFLNVKLSNKNLDIYVIRTAIFKAIKTNLKNFDGTLLDIGCGKMPYKDYILKNSKVKNYTGLDIENALLYDATVKPDFTWDGLKMPFEANSYDCAFGTEVLEHCSDPDQILKEVFRVIKPGGIFFFTVPFLWNLHEVPHDEYRYTPFSLKRHLNEAGFRDVQLTATGGWHASMAQMLGLWIKRSNISKKKQAFIIPIIKPVIIKLLKMDRNQMVHFKEGQMITGLSGIAYK
ncbi:class I SAM-dependent methyltransferase [Leeuwenhoekiella aequorea]|uniref:Ubiquinone/menaquinone biosynthesis C-methylase UbiE n=1 Tax=Leeuwenhoekiella aequorea TaxID=283736 RepID=A0A4Q0PDG7_9FLAO|nr:class I SAM-dependent methyltransferase [Leeuwenhoekiella aequorea]RXG24893.1 ubiquinone/menaquinone biosynthesis C-methylase UbiE [Leeuwenhoekiella aequorea]